MELSKTGCNLIEQLTASQPRISLGQRNIKADNESMLDNVGAASPAAELSSKLVSAVDAVTNAPRLTQRHEYRKQLNFTRVYSPSCEITGVE